MVEWKGQLEGKVGEKARKLDSVDSFYVPNFFVITKDEVEALVGNERSVETVERAEMPEELSDRLEDAYKEINMSSEVRKASGKARNLVGNQRNSSRVSVRVSADKPGNYSYRLNVGSGEIEESVVGVAASYYEEHSSGFPAVLVQKMIEPEASGAALKLQGGNLIEAVKGLGEALENGSTVPDVYLPGTGEKRVPDKQLESSVNPMNGDVRTRKTSRNSPLLKDSQIRQLSDKLNSERHSVKFAYSRGTFYAVDAFGSPDLELPKNLESLKVSKGKIEPGTEIVDVAGTPEKPVRARKGGYTSWQAQEARRNGVPAELSYRGESTGMEDEAEQKPFGEEPGEAAATEVLRADRELPSELESRYGVEFREVFLEDASDVLKFEGERFVLDSRSMDTETAVESLEYLEGECVCLVCEEATPKRVEAAVRNGALSIAVERDPEEAENAVLKEEKRLLLEAARSGSG